MSDRRPSRSSRLRRGLGPALLGLLAACSPGGSEPSPTPAAPDAPPRVLRRDGPPGARWDVFDLMREASQRTYAASDGGGHARLVTGDDGDAFAVVDRPGRFHIEYEVGPEGIARGGAVYLQVSPFWGWSTPQVSAPEAPGYTEIRTHAAEGAPGGIELRPETVDQQLLMLEVSGRALVAGDRLDIVYGAGPARARPDRYAERNSRFWIAVDGDGDGARLPLADSPGVDVRPGRPAALWLTTPSVVRPGESFPVVLAFVDAGRNAGVAVQGEVAFVDPPAGLELPASVSFHPADGGHRTIEGVAHEPGVYRLRARSGKLEAVGNPLVVEADGPRVLWGDLHGHSSFSDGTGLPEDYFRYARDIAGLDVAALTDHDRWGILPLVEHPELWEEIREQTRRFHAPGRFVTLLGFEWTNWIHGHRHVLYFADDGPLVDSVDPAGDTPQKLWAALEGHPALSIPHHPAGGPVATNWEIAPDPRFEPVVEIVSIHGSSEAPDSPDPIYDAVEGATARDALDRGYRLGFIGSGDRHDGHPGAYRGARPEGGVAAILSDERTREGVLAALRARRVYATNGPRIVLRTALGGYGMGQTLPLAAGETRSESLFVHVIAESPLERVELVRSGAVVDGLDVEGRLDVALQRDVDGLAPGEYVYVRAIQRDGGAAWSSPIFVGEPPPPRSATP